MAIEALDYDSNCYNTLQGPRAQIDRKLYKQHLQAYLNDYPNLTIQAGSVSDLVLNDKVTEEEQQKMISKGALQIVKGVRLGILFFSVHQVRLCNSN